MIQYLFPNNLQLKIRLLIVFSFCLYGFAQANVPSFQEVKDQIKKSEFQLFDRHGDLIHEYRVNLRYRRLEWISLQEMSPTLLEAVLISEDKRFFQHHGVDWIAITSALSQNLFRKTSRGASTIPMQVVALLDQKLKPKSLRRNWKQKVDQILEAKTLEKNWSKEQILEAYLNLISFRGELQGIASATHGLFKKSPNGLNREESLLLASLIRSPGASEKAVLKRACLLVKEMREITSCEAIRQTIEKQGLIPKPFPPAIALAPHVALQMSQNSQSNSTLDRKVQSQVLEILRRHILSLRDRNVKDAAALVVENQTGQIIAYVGSIGSLSSAYAVDGVRANRQAGSTLKPFLYGIALEKKYLTAASKLDDSILDISLGPGSDYRPRDFDHEYHGSHITLRTALASSLNIPAVKTLQLIRVRSLVERLKELGFQNLRSEEYYGPSLALGTADVSLWELVNAYRTLANSGVWNEMTFSYLNTERRKSKRVFSREVSFILGDILSDPLGRSLTFGLDSPLSQRFWTAAKTGTSKDMRDNWCIGFSRKYTVGVWTGNFSGESMWNVSGMSGAAPAWAEIIQALHQSRQTSVKQDLAPLPPQGLIQVQGEWYIGGTEPNLPSLEDREKRIETTKITYPIEGLIIARDPDIPGDLQRVFFETNTHNITNRWVLNNKELGPAGARFAWQPETPGDYTLKLISATGQVLDQVQFIVRR